MTKYCFRLIAALAGTTFVGGLPMAMAQVPAANDPAPRPVRPSASDREEIVVTAQRRSTKLSKTPVAVIALGNAALAKEGVRTERDLQSSVAGLTVRASVTANELNYAIRGQSVDAFSNSRPGVQPYIDEVAVPQGGGSSAFYDLNSVQVLKGPQGTLFGRNSTGGAVLFTTVQPSPDFGGYLTTRAGNYGLTSTEGALNIPVVPGAVDLRISGYYENRNGFQTNIANNSHPGAVLRYAVRGSLFTAITDDLHNILVFDYDHGGGSNAYVPYDFYAPGATNGGVLLNSAISGLYSPAFPAWSLYLAANPGIYPGGAVAYEALQKTRGNYVVDFNSPDEHEADNSVVSDILSYNLGDHLQIKNIVGYAHTRSTDMSDVDGTPYGIEAAKLTDAATEVTEEAQLLGQAFANRLSYVTGFYYATEKDVYLSDTVLLNLLPIIPPTPDNVLAEAHNTSYAGYFQGTYDLSELAGLHGLGFTGGVRYTGEDISAQQLPGSVYVALPGGTTLLSKSYEKLSWQFGLQEQIDPSLLIYIVSRHSFRSGGFNTQAPPSPKSSANGGALFYPEVATDVEVGAKFLGQIAGAPLRTNIAVYNEWVDNAQRNVFVPLPTGAAALTANVPQAEVTGVEIDGQINPTSWLNVGGTGAATDARFTQPSTTLLGTPETFGPYADTPKFSGNIYGETSFDLPSDLATLTLRAEEYAQSSFYFGSLSNTNTPGVKIPGYVITNFRIGIDNIRGTRLSLAGYVRNAFGRQYYVGGVALGNALSYNGAVPGEPRTFYFEASYKF